MQNEYANFGNPALPSLTVQNFFCNALYHILYRLGGVSVRSNPQEVNNNVDTIVIRYNMT